MLKVLFFAQIVMFLLLVFQELPLHLSLQFNLHDLLLMNFHVPFQFLLDFLELFILLIDDSSEPLFLLFPLLLCLLLGLQIPMQSLLFSLHLKYHICLEIWDR